MSVPESLLRKGDYWKTALHFQIDTFPKLLQYGCKVCGQESFCGEIPVYWEKFVILSQAKKSFAVAKLPIIIAKHTKLNEFHTC